MSYARVNASVGPGAGRGFTPSAKQRGAVLIFILVLLAIMTILGVSGIGNSLNQTKMAGNYYQTSLAFESAEYGLRVAEEWLIDNATPSSAWQTWFLTNTTMNGLYTTQNLTTPNNVEVCSGDVDCQFDPRDLDDWCNGGAGCDLPKGFVTLGDTLEGIPLETFAPPVTRQPQFIIEHVGPVGGSRSARIGARRTPSLGTAFRITAIGWGFKDRTRHIVQSHVILPL